MVQGFEASESMAVLCAADERISLALAGERAELRRSEHRTWSSNQASMTALASTYPGAPALTQVSGLTLAAYYASCILLDRHEAFFPQAVGYTTRARPSGYPLRQGN